MKKVLKGYNNKRIILYCCGFFVLLFSLFIGCDSVVMADDGGSYVSTDTTSGNGGGGYGVGGSPSKASWFYYSYQGYNEGESVYFLPIAFNVDGLSNAVTINGKCAKKGGGFWHFGRTDGMNGTLDCNYRNDYWVCGSLSSNYYNMSAGRYYHSQTINYHTWNSYWAYTAPSSSSIRHEIYNWGSLKYKATESSSNPWEYNDTAVEKAWKQACSTSNRSDCDKVPKDVSYFCWWPGMGDEIRGRATVGEVKAGTATYSSTEPSTIGEVKDSDYVKTDKIVNKSIACSVNGCLAKLGLYLKWENGSKDVTYKYRVKRGGTWSSWVSKTSSKPGSEKTLKVKGLKSDEVNIGGKKHNWGIETLYPGEHVCYQLRFPIAPGGSSDEKTVTSCAYAVATVSTSLDAKVKNNNVERYKTYLDEVYAKPGDKLKFQFTYSPTLQYAYNLKVPMMQIDNNSAVKNSDKNNNNPKKLGEFFNSKKPSNMRNWNNAFTVKNSYNSQLGLYSYDLGKSEQHVEENPKNSTDYFEVKPNHVGSRYIEKALINDANNSKTTPNKIQFSFSGSDSYGFLAKIFTDPKEDPATAYIPYNLNNSAEIVTRDKNSYDDKDGTILYAGESTNIKHNYKIGVKENSATTSNPKNEKYATSVADPKWRLELCIKGNGTNCTNQNFVVSSKTQDIAGAPSDFAINNEKEMKDGKTVSIQGGTSIIVPDVIAGTEVCIRSVIYPRTSGSDTNWEKDKNGYGGWAYSQPACFKVAKRPSLQVWGGNVFSNGGITTSVAVKKTLLGVGNGTFVFGSWGELGVISSGSIKEFASGASLGYSSASGKPHGGEKNQERLCSDGKNPGRSPMTFANKLDMFTDCNKEVGKLNSAVIGNTGDDRTDIFSRYVNNENVIQEGDGTVGATTIEKGTTKVFARKGNIEIQGNIIYGGEYNTFADMPKAVVYAKNIYIACGVTQIDAVLVAEEMVITCNNLGEVNDGNIEGAIYKNINEKVNSTPLRINGAVIANKLIANRTYGAATGNNSIVPAETINFDPSLYLWDSGAATTTTTPTNNTQDPHASNLKTTYIKELAPLY